jgi:DNA-binding transcriptional ArsR family regulator
VLEALFGNRTAEKVLLFIGTNREAYAQEIADRTKTALSLVQSQLSRLEAGGILVSRPRGRVRLYSFNPRFPFSSELETILRRAIDFLPARDQAAYLTRRRPRAGGKPL